MSFKPYDWEVIASTTQECIVDVSEWMSSNKLKLNQDKTELIVFASKQQAKNICNISLEVGANKIDAAPHVRNLGVMFDSQLTKGKPG
jgi:hypothetical protein